MFADSYATLRYIVQSLHKKFYVKKRLDIGAKIVAKRQFTFTIDNVSKCDEFSQPLPTKIIHRSSYKLVPEDNSVE